MREIASEASGRLPLGFTFSLPKCEDEEGGQEQETPNGYDHVQHYAGLRDDRVSVNYTHTVV